MANDFWHPEPDIQRESAKKSLKSRKNVRTRQNDELLYAAPCALLHFESQWAEWEQWYTILNTTYLLSTNYLRLCIFFACLLNTNPRALKNSNQLSYVEEQSWQKEQSGSKNNNNNMDNIPCVVHHPSHSLICQPVSCPFDCGVAFPLRLASNTSHTKGALLGSSAFPADVQSINRLIKVSDGY